MAATKSRSAMIVAANVGMIGARLVPTTAPTTSAVARQSAVPRKVAMARVVAQTRRGAAAERLELQLKLRDKGGYWQVFEIANLPELWRESREHEQRNAPTR